MRSSGGLKSARSPEAQHLSSQCAHCRDIRQVQVPDHLVSELLAGKVVVFAGAGVSTENSRLHGWTLYDTIYAQVGLAPDERPSFPKLMSQYCSRPDGRKRLVEQIHKRFKYIASFPELYSDATQFHKQLSTLFYIDKIVTTNWDDYFERECAAIPLVTGQDFVFHDLPERTVLKLHGSINNIGSIVATEEDYRDAEKKLQRGALGSALKTLLATRTILYAGYSLTDFDFVRIHNYIRKDLGKFARKAYILTLDSQSRERYEKLGLEPIVTDASHFLSLLKAHLLEDWHLLPDSAFDDVDFVLARIANEHHRLHAAFRPQDTPMMIYAAAYQDGLMHALQRITARKNTGEYSHRCYVVQKIRQYEEITSRHFSRGSYLDAAYSQGYENGLMWLILDARDRARMPYYFNFGSGKNEREIPTFAAYRRVMRRRLPAHQRALRVARQVVARQLGHGDALHHEPFLAVD